MNNNLIQYGPIFAAFGCKLKISSETAQLEVVEAPAHMNKIVQEALRDIAFYEDTAQYVDGASAICVAEFVDDQPNPLSRPIRRALLTALGIMCDGRYVAQVLSLQKNNRSWHFSEVANGCSHFGKACTNRGIEPDPDRKGRVSSRQPNEYHPLRMTRGKDARQVIAREQLVTPALANIFNQIPSDNLTRTRSIPAEFNLKPFANLPVSDRLDVFQRLASATM